MQINGCNYIKYGVRLEGIVDETAIQITKFNH